ncbi:MAG: hypothetical protein V2I54_00450 [Bacteroidales bacterium]|nr:hypothetical protein [Bacteroidales bacterium]
MKNHSIKLVLLFFLFNAIFIRCDDQIIETYLANVPVYMSYQEFRSAIKTEPPQAIKKPGKIYFYKNLLFINEYLQGVHVIDNSDPSAPQRLTFISIPGNIDITIKDDLLFADSYIDLVALEISEPENIHIAARKKGIFPHKLPPSDKNYRIDEVDFTKGIVVGWELQKVTKEVDQKTYSFYPWTDDTAFMANTYSSGNSAFTSDNSSLGVGGSMARFSIKNNTLFVPDHYALKIFDIENNNNILLKNTIYTGWAIETLFSYDDYLFLGSQNGMMIYDISTPFNPVFLSDHWHATSCDPVVFNGDFAYVTIRSGNLCGAVDDRLEVIDLSAIVNPALIKSYAMDEPYGLGLDNPVLFICDGMSGLKVYDITDKLHITDNSLAHYKDIQAYDAVPFNGVLTLIGEHMISQYDYSDLTDLRLLSNIEIEH